MSTNSEASRPTTDGLIEPESSCKYGLLAELGHGGMADVYLAVMRGPAGFGFTKLVVIKQLRRHLAEDPEFVGLFMNEARLAARLNHPNIVATYDVGQVGRVLYLAMEYLEGQALSRILHRLDERMPLGLHLRVLSDVLVGLHHAHELADYDGSPLGIVHRDVSPQNVFVTYDGVVKLLDFGVAKAAAGATQTRGGSFKGKIGYMSPDQALGGPIDRRVDIFSVGIMLWEAVARRRIWAGCSEIEIVRRIIQNEIPRIRSVVPDVPIALERMCDRSLAFDPDQRYLTAADFSEDLEKYIGTLDGRFTMRELSAHVTGEFRGDRERIRATIEWQLGAVASLSADDAMTDRLPNLGRSIDSIPPLPGVRVGTPSSRKLGAGDSSSSYELVETGSLAPRDRDAGGTLPSRPPAEAARCANVESDARSRCPPPPLDSCVEQDPAAPPSTAPTVEDLSSGDSASCSDAGTSEPPCCAPSAGPGSLEGVGVTSAPGDGLDALTDESIFALLPVPDAACAGNDPSREVVSERELSGSTQLCSAVRGADEDTREPGGEAVAVVPDALVSVDHSGRTVSPPHSMTTRRRTLLAVAGILVALGGGRWVLRPAMNESPAANAGQRAPAMAGSVETGEIELRLSAQPAHATLSVDGRLMDNPHVGKVQRDRLEHRIIAWAEGYIPKLEIVSFDRDQNLGMVLSRKNQVREGQGDDALSPPQGSAKIPEGGPDAGPPQGTRQARVPPVGRPLVTTANPSAQPKGRNSPRPLDTQDPWSN